MSQGQARLFPDTCASVVLILASEDPRLRAQAMGRLADAYLEPLYAYVRLRFRKTPEDAQEIVHGFFASAIERRQLERFDPRLAHFRTFLKMCIERYAANVDKAARRAKRGGGQRALDLDELDRTISDLPPGSAAAASEAFDRLWTRRVLTIAIDDLRGRLESAGKGHYFRVFSRALVDPAEGDADRPPSYAEIASELGLSVSNVTNYLFAARREFRRSLIATLRALTASEEEFELQAAAMVGPPPYG